MQATSRSYFTWKKSRIQFAYFFTGLKRGCFLTTSSAFNGFRGWSQMVLRGYKQKILNHITIFPNSILLFRELHDDEIEDEIREAFRCFDRDGHGFIPISGRQNRISNFRFSIFRLNLFSLYNSGHKIVTIRLIALNF